MMFRPPKSYLFNSSKDFLSDIDVSIIQPKNLAGQVRPAQFRAIVQQEAKVFAPQIVEDIMFRSSMKSLIGGNKILFG